MADFLIEYIKLIVLFAWIAAVIVLSHLGERATLRANRRNHSRRAVPAGR
jgi:hypothetical protein